VVTTGGSIPTAAQVAAEVRSNLETGAPIPVNVEKINDVAIIGGGVSGNSFRVT
jgi:hypothetical protein